MNPELSLAQDAITDQAKRKQLNSTAEVWSNARELQTD